MPSWGRHTNVAPSQPRYNFCIATQLPAKRTARRVARAPSTVSQDAWPYRGRAVAVSWPAAPCHGVPLRAASQPCPALLCHDTIDYIVTQHKLKMGNKPFHSLLFFFSHQFFFLIPATGKPPKENIFFFSFSSKLNKFIKIYFIHFFSSFTHCKTLENFFSSHHFFFHLILDYLLKISQTTCS